MNKESVRDSFLFIYKLFNVNVSGQRNFDILKNGETAIIAFFPHTGHLDAPFARLVVSKEFRERLQFPAGADYWYKEGTLSSLRELAASLILPNFPINRSGANRSDILESIGVAENYLNSGYPIVMSPEGTRSSLPLAERQLKSGIAELILRTEKPVIPLLFDGLQDVMPKGVTVPRIFKNGARREILAIVGKPVYFEKRPDLPRSRQRKEILNQLKSVYQHMKNDGI